MSSLYQSFVRIRNPSGLFSELEEAVKKAREEEIKIPFGIGVAGTVAQNKKVINIRDAYKVRPGIYTFPFHLSNDPILFSRETNINSVILVFIFIRN